MKFLGLGKGDRALIEGGHGIHGSLPEAMARADASASSASFEAPRPAPQRPTFMVPHVQGLVGQTLVKLRHDEHALEAKLANISERLRQTKVAIEALTAADELLLSDMRETDLVSAMQARDTTAQTVEEAADAAVEAAIEDFERELEVSAP